MPVTLPLSRRHVIYNLVMFQLGWFFCAYGAAHDMPWLAFLVLPPIVIWHLSHARQQRQEARLMLAMMLMGLVLDQSLLSMGMLSFPDSGLPRGWLPPWMLMLWLLFATTLNVSLRWTRASLGLRVLLGAVGGPMAYLAGEHLGAIRLPHEASVVAIAFAWAVAFPLSILLASRYDGMAEAGQAKTGQTNTGAKR